MATAEALPADLLGVCLELAGGRAAARCASVCRRWRDGVEASRALWARLSRGLPLLRAPAEGPTAAALRRAPAAAAYRELDALGAAVAAALAVGGAGLDDLAAEPGAAAGVSSVDSEGDQGPEQALGAAGLSPRSYWSSAGSDDPASAEHLLLRLGGGRPCVVAEVALRGFAARFQPGAPAFPPRFLRVRVGNAPADFHYESPLFDVRPGDGLQRFRLDRDLVVGSYVRLDLLGRHARQRMDNLFYTALERVRVLGVPAAEVGSVLGRALGDGDGGAVEAVADTDTAAALPPPRAAQLAWARGVAETAEGGGLAEALELAPRPPPASGTNTAAARLHLTHNVKAALLWRCWTALNRAATFPRDWDEFTPEAVQTQMRMHALFRALLNLCASGNDRSEAASEVLMRCGLAVPSYEVDGEPAQYQLDGSLVRNAVLQDFFGGAGGRRYARVALLLCRAGSHRVAAQALEFSGAYDPAARCHAHSREFVRAAELHAALLMDEPLDVRGILGSVLPGAHEARDRAALGSALVRHADADPAEVAEALGLPLDGAADAAEAVTRHALEAAGLDPDGDGDELDDPETFEDESLAEEPGPFNVPFDRDAY